MGKAANRPLHLLKDTTARKVGTWPKRVFGKRHTVFNFSYTRRMWTVSKEGGGEGFIACGYEMGQDEQ